MDLGNPHRVLSHPLDGSVATVLARTSQALTGREVARLAPEGSQPGISKALTRLVESGLVDSQEAGNARLYTLNRDHLAAPAALTLAGLRTALISRLREQIGNWGIPPAHASMFGSAARGDGESGSDIDLLIVRPANVAEDEGAWREQLDALRPAVERWTGNRASITELGEQDAARLASERPPVATAIAADAIGLAGMAVRRLLKDDPR